MSTTVRAGWLKDNQGNKFAPKTVASQVILNDEITLEDRIGNILTEKAERVHTHTLADIEGYEGGGIQADWDQGNPDASDFIKNKPFYSTIVENKMIYDGSDDFEEPSFSASPFLLYEFDGSIKPIPEHEYTINYNGSFYKCTAHYDEYWNIIYLGNVNEPGAAWGDAQVEFNDDSVPFAIVYYLEYNDDLADFFTFNDTALVKLTITGDMEEFKTIDERFLPYTIAREEDIMNIYSQLMYMTELLEYISNNLLNSEGVSF